MTDRNIIYPNGNTIFWKCQRRLELTEKRRGKMTQNAGYFSAGMSAGGVRMTPDFLRFLSLYVSPRMFITWA